MTDPAPSSSPVPPIELSRYCVPFSPFRGKVEEATVALVSTAGVRLASDPPFDLDGDTSYRVIPGTAKGSELKYDDEHYDHACVDRDINCVFPIDRLRELAEEKRIGGLAEKHFSMGFTMAIRRMWEETVPRIVAELDVVHPDLVVLTGG
jgi:D-proline reductase (dithiol) PrdB